MCVCVYTYICVYIYIYMCKYMYAIYIFKYQFSCSVLSNSFNPTDCSMPGFPVHHQLLELAQTHVHGVGDAIQPSYPLSSPSPPAFSLSQHQGLSQWISSLYQVDKVLEPQLQHQFSSVHFSHSIVSDSLQPHGMQHARPPCPSPTPRACSNSWPWSQW